MSIYEEGKEEEETTSHATRARSSKPSQEALERAQALHGAILEVKPDHRLRAGLTAATAAGWGRQIDLLHRRDGVEWGRVDRVIAALPTIHFWADKIESGASLRKHFDQLENAVRAPQRPAGRPLEWVS